MTDSLSEEKDPFRPTCHLRMYRWLEYDGYGGAIEMARLEQKWERFLFPRDGSQVNDHEWRRIPEHKSYE